MYSVKLIGTDTELFLKDKAGLYIPAVGLIGGTKKEPRPIDDKGSAVQEDNVMVEFNTPPAKNAEDFVANINHVISYVVDEMRDKGLVIAIDPSAEFKPELLSSAQAQVMGCDPDYNAWTFEENPTMSAARMQNIRTAGGHLHVSFSVRGQNPNRIQMMNLIRMLDLTLGVPATLLDNDERRRSFYGRPGAHRIKAEDRVEYRVLSNFWCRNDTLKKWAFNNVIVGIRKLNILGMITQENPWGSYLEQDICNCISQGDKKLAKKLIKTHNIEMP